MRYYTCVFVSVQRSSYYYFSCVSLHASLQLYTWCLFLTDAGIFTVIIYFCYSSIYSRSWRCYSCLAKSDMLSVICYNLSRGIGGWEMRAISLFACRPSAHLLFSSLLCRAGRETRRCTVKIWQRGNEETLSTTDLDTIQIGFAKIPVIYHLFLGCFPLTPHPCLLCLL